MNFAIPKQRFIFKSQIVNNSSELGAISAYALFKEDWEGVDFEKSYPPFVGEIFKKQKLLEAYSPDAGSVLYLIEHDLIFLGMGELETWHPEKACETFRNLGAQFFKVKNFFLRIHLGATFQKALTEHLSKEREFNKNLELNFTEKKSEEKKSSQNTLENQKKDKYSQGSGSNYDYIAKLELRDLLHQLIVCMNIGAESMDILKSKRLISTQKKSENTNNAEEKQIEVEIIEPTNIDQSILQRGQCLSELMHGFRGIASLPGNYLTPKTFEEYARHIAKEFKLQIKVFQEEELEKMGCGGIISVGRGSVIPPRMLLLEYTPENLKNDTQKARPIVLVGKGITFDTGGVSLKPAGEMHEMKYDMCGSALVLHAIAFAASQKLNIPIVSILGIAENMPDGNAIKPGDVYVAYDGSTVEIQNTDAEGRLVLGDLLAYAVKNYDPLCMLDFATLTGACVIALGHEAAGVMTASNDLYSFLHEASLKSLDKIWRLPHWSVYGAGLKSDIADQRNVAGRAAGTISAMRFLAHFVPETIPWAHIDIAGTSWREKGSGSQGRGATGWGLRLLSQFMDILQSKFN